MKFKKGDTVYFITDKTALRKALVNTQSIVRATRDKLLSLNSKQPLYFKVKKVGFAGVFIHDKYFPASAWNYGMGAYLPFKAITTTPPPGFKPSKSVDDKKPPPLPTEESLKIKVAPPFDFSKFLNTTIVKTLLSKYGSHLWLSDIATDMLWDKVKFPSSYDLYSMDTDPMFKLLRSNYAEFVRLYPKITNWLVNLLLLDLLTDWKDSSEKTTVQMMLKLKPLLDSAKKINPKLVVPTNKYKVAYRGTRLKKPKLITFFKSTNVNDWVPTRIRKNVYWVYTKKKFTYQPHQEFQSWSVDEKIAQSFSDDYVLASRTNTKDFYFDPVYLNSVNTEYDDEYETIHYGKNLNVLLAVGSDIYNDLIVHAKGSKKNTDGSFASLASKLAE